MATIGGAKAQSAQGPLPGGSMNRPALKLDLGAVTYWVWGWVLFDAVLCCPLKWLSSETQLRRQEYRICEKQCYEIVPGLYLAGDYVARNREILEQHSITHVLNSAGFICKEYFQGELEYLTLFLEDTPYEDILCLLHLSIQYIERAISSGGRVLVHCSQGISLSATFVIAYLMWKTQKTYGEAFAHVKAAREAMHIPASLHHMY